MCSCPAASSCCVCSVKVSKHLSLTTWHGSQGGRLWALCPVLWPWPPSVSMARPKAAQSGPKRTPQRASLGHRPQSPVVGTPPGDRAHLRG